MKNGDDWSFHDTGRNIRVMLKASHKTIPANMPHNITLVIFINTQVLP